MKRSKRVYDKLCTLECKTHRPKMLRRSVKSAGMLHSASLSNLSLLVAQGCSIDGERRRGENAPRCEDSDSTETSHEEDSDGTEYFPEEDSDAGGAGEDLLCWGPKEFSIRFHPLGALDLAFETELCAAKRRHVKGERAGPLQQASPAKKAPPAQKRAPRDRPQLAAESRRAPSVRVLCF